jgi:hypothetical protein
MNNAEQALKEWIKTQSLSVSDVEEHGFINGYNWALNEKRPNNSVLVPCDKLAEMQAEIETLKEINAKQVDYISEQKVAYEKLWKEHMELFWKHEQDKDLTNE